MNKEIGDLAKSNPTIIGKDLNFLYETIYCMC